jgi:hypothetical protein
MLSLRRNLEVELMGARSSLAINGFDRFWMNTGGNNIQAANKYGACYILPKKGKHGNSFLIAQVR